MAEINNKAEYETISGSVDSIVFRKSDSAFTVLNLDSKGELVTVVGELPMIEPGEEVTLTGNFVSHPTFGPQFKALLCERRLPASSGAMIKYLSSGVVKGVGRGLAKRIVDMFGSETLNVVENEPNRLALVKGVSQRMADDISEEFKKVFGIRKVVTELSTMGINVKAAAAAWKKWGNDAVNAIKDNPYLLCTPEIGMPFPEVDDLFRTNIGDESEKRISAGIMFILEHNLQNGHVCLPLDKLLASADAFLSTECSGDELTKLIDEHAVETAEFSSRVYVYLPEYYYAETMVAGRLKLMLSTGYDESADAEGPISSLEEELQIEYDILQRQAIKQALQNHIFVLTGGPGTGKTTTLNAIIRLLEYSGEKVLLAAPTGRAAKRLSELTGKEAKTIHRLLEVEAGKGGGFGSFRRNEKNPLKCDTLIIDEMSMVDSMLFMNVLKALNFSSRLILVGDSDQLPSVGAGNVLRDILASDILPSVRLETIFRQAAESMIITNAHDIVRGELPELDIKDNDFFFITRENSTTTAKTVVDLVQKRLPDAYGFSFMRDIEILCPGKKGTLGTWSLNKELQGKLNPRDGKKNELSCNGTLFREGDKVMQNHNNYEIAWIKDDGEKSAGIYNGDIGIIENIDKRAMSARIRFDDRVAEYNFEALSQLEHAWAITVHKSQGNEFEAVVIPLFDESPLLSYRNLLYTAVTRAKQLLVMVGDKRSVMRMVGNDRKTVRYTNLKRFLMEDDL